MAMFLLFVTIALIIYATGGVSFLAKDITRYIAISIGFFSTMAYINQYVADEIDANQNTYFYIAYIALYIFMIYYIRLVTKPEPLAIVADRQRYWEEVKDSDIYGYYANRRELKSDRVEAVGINKFETKLITKNENDTIFVSPQFFLNLQKIGSNLTRLSKLDDIEAIQVYNAIFKRLKAIIKEKEILIDYNEILQQNDNYAEYFLMNLWDDYTKDINIGIANLNIVCQDWIQEELVYSLDILSLNNVKLKGSALFYAYMTFKGKNIAKQEEPKVEQSDNLDDDPFF